MNKLAISILFVLFVRRFSSKKFIGDGFMVREMESLVVPCWNQWNPKYTVAKYRWIDHLGRSALRNFMVLHGDGTMEIRAAQSSDTGSYACIISVPGEEELQLHYGITVYKLGKCYMEYPFIYYVLDCNTHLTRLKKKELLHVACNNFQSFCPFVAEAHCKDYLVKQSEQGRVARQASGRKGTSELEYENWKELIIYLRLNPQSGFRAATCDISCMKSQYVQHFNVIGHNLVPQLVQREINNKNEAYGIMVYNKEATGRQTTMVTYCEKGYELRDSIICVPCNPGYYSDDTMVGEFVTIDDDRIITRCKKCPVNTWQSMFGSSSCNKCPYSTSNPRRGSTRQSDCNDEVDEQHPGVTRKGLIIGGLFLLTMAFCCGLFGCFFRRGILKVKTKEKRKKIKIGGKPTSTTRQTPADQSKAGTDVPPAPTKQPSPPVTSAAEKTQSVQLASKQANGGKPQQPTSAPPSTICAPQVQAPATTTCPPVTTTCLPVTTTCPPVTTTCPPVTTTCPHVTTTCPPVTITCPPVTTTCPLVTTICPPVTTTCAPQVQAPATTCATRAQPTTTAISEKPGLGKGAPSTGNGNPNQAVGSGDHLKLQTPLLPKPINNTLQAPIVTINASLPHLVSHDGSFISYVQTSTCTTTAATLTRTLSEVHRAMFDVNWNASGERHVASTCVLQCYTNPPVVNMGFQSPHDHSHFGKYFSIDSCSTVVPYDRMIPAYEPISNFNVCNVNHELGRCYEPTPLLIGGNGFANHSYFHSIPNNLNENQNMFELPMLNFNGSNMTSYSDMKKNFTSSPFTCSNSVDARSFMSPSNNPFLKTIYPSTSSNHIHACNSTSKPSKNSRVSSGFMKTEAGSNAVFTSAVIPSIVTVVAGGNSAGVSSSAKPVPNIRKTLLTNNLNKSHVQTIDYQNLNMSNAAQFSDKIKNAEEFNNFCRSNLAPLIQEENQSCQKSWFVEENRVLPTNLSQSVQEGITCVENKHKTSRKKGGKLINLHKNKTNKKPSEAVYIRFSSIPFLRRLCHANVDQMNKSGKINSLLGIKSCRQDAANPNPSGKVTKFTHRELPS